MKPVRETGALSLRLIVRRRRTLLVLRHEGVELFLVLGVTQAIEEILELVDDLVAEGVVVL